MANFDVDKGFFEGVKEHIKGLNDALSNWQQKETALHSIAEVNAKQTVHPTDPNYDAHVYAHKKAIKKAIADNAKANDDGQGGPGVKSAQPNVNHMPVTAQTHSAASPRLPMAGQHGNTGANGNMALAAPASQQLNMQHIQGGPTTPNPVHTQMQQAQQQPKMPLPGLQSSLGPPAPPMAQS